jgi:beta-N-acetylhexosaminidase
VCNNPDAAAEVLSALQGHQDPVSMARCVRLHGRPALSWDRLRETIRWHNAVRLATDISEAPMDELDL